MQNFEKISMNNADYQQLVDSMAPEFDDIDYTGYGDSDVTFGDFDDEKQIITEIDVYNEFLNALSINNETMQLILQSLTKDANANFSFLQANKDFTVIYFKDQSNHIVPVTYNKLCQALEVLKSIMKKGKRKWHSQLEL